MSSLWDMMRKSDLEWKIFQCRSRISMFNILFREGIIKSPTKYIRDERKNMKKFQEELNPCIKEKT